jgi:hypothetical protein
MNEEEFFSPNHNRLLGIALWAKYLAWVVLVIYILWGLLQIFQHQTFLIGNSQIQHDIWSLEELEFTVSMATVLLRGVIYYLVLKGIFLGLNMIVETDINYRERQKAGVQ